MRSTDGHHWIALDHIRAVAALLVLSWHFIHGFHGFPVPFGHPPAIFPLAILDEGHTGVALFMVLSGYLFAKLLDGKSVNYPAFYWNRFLRLFPLLVIALALGGLEHYLYRDEPLKHYFSDIFTGLIIPTKPIPNNAWSVVVEVHFYLLLPFLLMASRKWPSAPLWFLAAMIAIRIGLSSILDSVQVLSYFTIVGRADQFALGIIAFQNRRWFRDAHVMAVATILLFGAFYYWFDASGGFYNLGGKYPSPSPLWVILPTVEGIAYATIVAYYDNSYRPSVSGISGFIGKAGVYSYSIYLLHHFIVFRMPKFINNHLLSLSNFYVAFAGACACYLIMMGIGWASYRFIEEPFLRFRVVYTSKALNAGTPAAANN